MENEREKFLKIYAEIPEGLRADIIAIVDNKTYTWDTAYLEIKDKTKLGEKILKTLKSVGII
ncbi:hypothetical protein J4402_05235 [Candidatus Pacearchaeota archaeon]|nr:hypothetical protein [Candidatus Pacearchaeota archaeon]